MNIGSYIAEILLSESKIEIAGFGCIEKIYKPASIHPVEHSFSPPSAELVLKPLGTPTSTALRDALMRGDNLDSEKADARINEFVAELNSRLKEGNRVHLPPLGTLKMDLNGQISFEMNPGFNLNKKSYGLPVFVSPAIQRRETPLQATPLRKKRRIPAYALITAAILVLASGTGIAVYYFGMPEIFTAQKKVVQTLPIKADSIQEPVQNPEVAVVDTTETLNSAEAAIIPQNEGSWFILAACFSSEKNAEKYLNKLVSEGYPATIQGQTRSGLYRVCYRSYPSQEAAETDLPEIHKKNSQAYIIQLQ